MTSVEPSSSAVGSLKKWKPIVNIENQLLEKIKYFQGFKIYENDDDTQRKTSAMFLTEADEMFAIGHNNEDNLLALSGNDFANPMSVINKPRKIRELSKKNIKKFTVTERFGVALTFDGKIIYWGMEMKSLQFQQRGKSYVKLPYEHKLAFKTADFACGAHSITFLTDEGNVIIWGCINLFYSEFYDFKKLKIKKNVEIVSLSCGWYHVALLDRSGQVWTFGYGSVGQLGYNWSADEFGYTNLTRVDLPKNISCVQVECGAYSTLFLMANGEVYACGSNSQTDHLCVDEVGIVRKPAKVLFDDPIEKIAAAYAWFSGRWQSVFAAQSKTKLIFKWGDDPKLEKPGAEKGARDLNDLFVNFKTPQSLGEVIGSGGVSIFDKTGEGIEKQPVAPPPSDLSVLNKWDFLSDIDEPFLSTIQYFSVFTTFVGIGSGLPFAAFLVTKDDTVYAMGFNKRKFLGLTGPDSETDFVESPVKVDNLSQKQIVKIITTDFHGGTALSKSGSVYVWDNEPARLHKQLNGRLATNVGNGSTYFLYLLNNFEVYFDGRISIEYDYLPLTKIETPRNVKITDFSCGSWHCALLSDDGEVYTFGYGEIYEHLGYKWTKGSSPLKPKKVQLPSVCTKVACGVTSTFFLLKNGELYACGTNTAISALGVGHKKNTVIIPEKVVIDEPIADLEVSRTYTYSGGQITLMVVRTASGKFYSNAGTLEKLSVIDDVSTMVEAFGNKAIPQSLSLVPVLNEEEEPKFNHPTPQNYLFDDPLYSDVTLILSDGSITAHKALLYMKSSFFKKRLSSADQNLNTLNLLAENPKALRTYLKYFYGLSVDRLTSEQDLLALHDLVVQDGNEKLLKICRSWIFEKLMSPLLKSHEKYQTSTDFRKLVELFGGITERLEI